MIPKKIHYCWFGKKEKPDSFQRCFESWERFCPDYEIVEWNESNAPNENQHFYRNALRKKRYAFVADCVRTEVIYKFGGIYMDTDMLLLKPLDNLLILDLFIGEEVEGRVNFALFGATPHHRLLKKMNLYYNNFSFDGFNPPVITHTFKLLFKQELLFKNEVVFASKYFYPLSYEDKDKNYIEFINEKSMAVHLWDHSWKKETSKTKFELLLNLFQVSQDFLFFNYPYSYFRRYFKEFSRKLIQELRKNLIS